MENHWLRLNSKKCTVIGLNYEADTRGGKAINSLSPPFHNSN